MLFRNALVTSRKTIAMRSSEFRMAIKAGMTAARSQIMDNANFGALPCTKCPRTDLWDAMTSLAQCRAAFCEWDERLMLKTYCNGCKRTSRAAVHSSIGRRQSFKKLRRSSCVAVSNAARGSSEAGGAKIRS